MKTPFGENKVAEKTPIIELNSVYPISDLRDDQQTSGSGSVTANESEYRIRHQASGDFARLASSSRGRYQPGTVGEAGVGVRMGSLPSSGDFRAIWGYFDMELSGGSNTETINNGAVFGHDKDGTFVAVYRNGTQKMKTHSDNWNINSTSDASLFDLTNGNIFQVDYLYYGYGSIVFRYIESTHTGIGEAKTVHVYQPSEETSLQNTNLQVGGLVESSNTSSDFSMYIGGRQYNVVGNFQPRRRINTARNSGVSTGTSGFTPVVSVQKQSGQREIASDLFGFEMLSTTNALVQVRLNSTLTGASFGSLDEQSDSETSLQQDTSATAVDTTTGVKLFEGLVSGGGGPTPTALSGTSSLPIDIPDEGTVTLAAQAVSSAGSVDGVLQMQETF